MITGQKMKFFITDFISKCDQICSFLRIWSHLLKISAMEKFIFCAVIELSLESSVAGSFLGPPLRRVSSDSP